MLTTPTTLAGALRRGSNVVASGLLWQVCGGDEVSVNPSARVGVPVQVRRLRVGDRVRVRDEAEILATLDAQGRVDGLPFMPEMLGYVGRTFTVDAVIHRTCDTVKADGTGGTTRQMERAVHLEGVRCNGSTHGGCQARCLIFWKEDWLEKAPPSHSTPVLNDGCQSRESAAPDEPSVPDLLLAATRDAGQNEDDPIYSCQATEMSRATSFVSARDARIWLQDWRSRNANARTVLASIAVLLFNKWQGAQDRLPRPLRIGSGRTWPSFVPSGEKRRYPPLDLQPGEVVEVRSKEEIEATLDDKGCLRGLRFAAEMVPYCGTRARVLDRVERIIDEKTGRMLRLRDCIMLEHVWCQGTFRALCRRKIYTFWREAWLRRVENHGCSDTRPGDQ